VAGRIGRVEECSLVGIHLKVLCCLKSCYAIHAAAAAEEKVVAVA